MAVRDAPAGRPMGTPWRSNFTPANEVKSTSSRCPVAPLAFCPQFLVLTISPSWSRDGKWLYFASKSGNEPFQAWKIPAQGGSPIQLTKNGGISPVESPDGHFLYYAKYEQGGLWRLPLRGGEETQILGDISGGEWPNWAGTSSGIYFLKFAKSRHGTIEFLDFATHKILPLWTLENEPGWGLSISRDGKSIVYIQDEYAESSIMLVTNFR